MSKEFASSEDLLSQITIYTKYAKYNESLKRRSNWTELVNEVANMHKRRYPQLADEIDSAFQYVHDKKVIPSMRSMQFAGPAIELGESRIYNCAYLPIDDRIAFREVMFLLMGGTGVGYSVQRHHVAKLPSIKLPDSEQRFIIGDSIEGWSDAVNRLCRAYFDGRTRPVFDYRDIRPKGSPLKKSGGKAPGPEKLKVALENIEAVFKQAINRKLKTIEVHDIVCYLASCVVSGGVRDSAMISLFSPDDDEMLSAKGYIYVEIDSISQHGVTVRPDVFKNTAGGISANTYGKDSLLLKMSDAELEKLLTEKKLPWWYFHPQRGKANNSALLLRSDIGREDFMYLWAKTKASDAGEPGCYWSNDKNTGTNPCLVGSTPVYVADGRGVVTIKQLADEGNDVDVFAFDSNDNIVIRKMVNPRLTGTKVPVMKVKLDSGDEITVTPNHKFKLSSGEYVQASDLKYGDSLRIITRFEASIKDILPQANSRSSDYYWISNRQKSKQEHRYIAERHHGDLTGLVVHHCDFNAKNNSPHNLLPMSRSDHDALHASFLHGDNNPMAKLARNPEEFARYRMDMSKLNSGDRNPSYSGVSNAELFEHAKYLTCCYGRRFSTREWESYATANNLPLSFSKFRKGEFGGIAHMSHLAAINTGHTKYTNEDPRIVKLLNKHIAAGYDADILDGRIIFTKTCGHCSTSFVTYRREHMYCTRECADDSKLGKNLTIACREKIKDYHEVRKSKVRSLQVEVASRLKFQLGRPPKKKEWVAACKEANISHEVARPTSPYRTYKQLLDDALDFNHKVVSVEYCGVEDVYNGTVDEFHNFFVGAFKSTTKSGKEKLTFLNNLQCGEIALQEFQFCNLTSVNAANVVDQDDFNARVKAAAFIGTLQASYTDFHYLRLIWRETTEREALLGVSLTGIAYGRLDNLDLSQAAITATTENHRVAGLLGIKRAARVTTIKPEGSGSLALSVLGAGIHAIHDRYFIRRIRFNKNDRLYDYLKVMVPNLVELDQFDSEKAIISLPIKAPTDGKFRDETALEFLERVKKYYTEWVRPGHRRGVNAHNVSATIYIKPHEWDVVGEWMWENRSYYNGLSCLPYDGGTYVQAPYESISEERYNELASQLQKISLEDVTEDDDFTNRINELACAGGACLI